MLQLIFRTLLPFMLHSPNAVAAPTLPFPAQFYDVKLAKFQQSLEAFRRAGMGPQTLTMYRSGNEWMMAGSFDKRVPSPWDVRLNLGLADLQPVYQGAGNTPAMAVRELSVTSHNDGPHFTLILRPYDAFKDFGNTYWDLRGEDVESLMSVADYNNLRSLHYGVYPKEGVNKHFTVFWRDGKKSKVISDYTLVGIRSEVLTRAAAGWQITSISLSNSPSGFDLYAAVFTKQDDATYPFFNLTRAELKAKMDSYRELGYSVIKLVEHSNTFTVIFAKELSW